MTGPSTTEFIAHDPADARTQRLLGDAMLPTARDIRGRLGADRQAATSDFVENRHITVARDTAVHERDAWLAHHTADEAIRAEFAQQLIGERAVPERQAKAKAEHDARIARVDTAAASSLAAFRAETRASNLPPATVEVTAENGLIFQRFQLGGSRVFLDEAKAVLRTAVDSGTPNADKVRANQSLAKVYQTLVRRRADSPEAHAKDDQGAYSELADLIDAHLNSLLGVERQRIADGLIATIEGERAWVRKVLNDKLAGRWDDLILSTGAPILYGKFRPKS